ncbi:phosphoadenosine phosphosulfate reductase [Halopolyspora algeriensis]|uniref:Adenosine 5'-phosphosulfate reductase n=1 Tax=Halopolyspora algeriensis TaxID=1500506 RepID=A0A368VHR8_9ACTN|nr:phosphoadenylyl-sulfate reductase [Halopolyspora algeriensis]RCW40808.1 phosphoadenosine phosphosulfate reductase [Halopolyspora algeriensis]TQM53275.1 phosphoadenosine phosphosulfate reductase [Halopolyspora algeriensis]
MTADTPADIGVRRSDEELRALVEQAAPRLAEATAGEALRWAAETFGDGLIVASNMQDASLIDLAAKAKPGVDILFLETGYHFAETIGTRDAVEQLYDVTIVNAMPEQTVEEQDASEGPQLYSRDPNRCCHLRKVLPLRNTLARYEAWVTGIRRVEAPTRANTPIVDWDERNSLVKVNPLAAWTDEDVDSYIAEHNVLVNPLVPAGFPSIGCQPCTAKPAPGADPRSGRWAGTSKTECGLHG